MSPTNDAGCIHTAGCTCFGQLAERDATLNEQKMWILSHSLCVLGMGLEASKLRKQLRAAEQRIEALTALLASPHVDNDGTVALHIRRDGGAVILRYPNPAAGYNDMQALLDWSYAIDAALSVEADAK